MASYSIIILPTAEKELRRLPNRDVLKIRKKVVGLRESPFPPQAEKLSGGDHEYRLRVGDYRVLYEADTKAKKIFIYRIRHRKDVYRH